MTPEKEESLNTPNEESVQGNPQISLASEAQKIDNSNGNDSSENKKNERERIKPLETVNGWIRELSPRDIALQIMSYYVLTGTFLLMAFFSGWYILSESHLAKLQNDFVAMCIDDATNTEGDVETKVGKFCSAYSQEAGENNAAAEEVFEFMKNFLPSIITLVLGAHYVTKSNE